MDKVKDTEIEEGDMLILDLSEAVVFVVEVERCAETERALMVTVRGAGNFDEVQTVHPSRLWRLPNS